MATATLQLLGTVRVTWTKGTPPRFRSPRARALLGYLAVERRPVAREQLAALFWPDLSLADGRANLRRVLHNVAAMLPDCWRVDRYSAEFSPTAAVKVDLDTFRQLEQQAKWRQAADLVRGEYMEGIYLEDNLEFETWLLGERERWRQRVEWVLLRAAGSVQLEGEYALARRYLARLLQLVPWHEEGHRRMMRLLAQSGRLSAALKQYDRCQQTLEEELAVPPSTATTRLYERIKIARTMSAHNLPPAATTFVGREEELATLRPALARAECRLLTLTGLGGIGKTRLALETARSVATADYRLFLHGVVYVPLVGVDRPDVLAAIGAALGLAFSGRQPAESQLLAYLRDLEMLLLLDNYEHLLPDTRLLARILQEASGVKLLVTSRERLNLAEEWLHEVDGLPYPKDEARGHPGGDAQGGAPTASERLFLERARQIEVEVPLSLHARDVQALCRLVQGMPLALELSVARLKRSPLAGVVADLKRGLDIMRTDARNASPRHASLHAAFAASWNSLTHREQDTLAQLSIFRGGFTRHAAKEVAGASPTILSRLVDQSLIRMQPTGRYEMHELLRQYGSEKLAARPAMAASAQATHASYMGVYLREREERLLETLQEATLRELDQEIDNIRQAWRWLTEHARVAMLDEALWTVAAFHVLRGQAVQGLSMVEDTLARIERLEERGESGRRLQARLWLFRGYFLHYAGRLVEARKLLPRVLERLRRDGNAQDVGWALSTLGETVWDLRESGSIPYLEEGLAMMQRSGPSWLEGYLATQLAKFLRSEFDESSFKKAEVLARHALVIGRRLDNPLVLCNALRVGGLLASRRGEHQRAKQAFDEALRAADRIESPWLHGRIMHDLGVSIAVQGKFADAKEYFLETSLLFRRMGARQWEAIQLNSLGELARGRGELDLAPVYYQRAMAIYEELGLTNNSYWVACNHGHVLLRQSLLESAAGRFSYCLPGVVGSKDQTLARMTLIGVAGVLAARERGEEAARLAGAAVARYHVTPRKLDPQDQQDWDRIVGEIEDQADEETIAAAWEAGRLLSLAEAVSLALAGLQRSASAR